MFRYIVSATSSIGAHIKEEVLGCINATTTIKEFERLGSSNILVTRKHDGISISCEEIKTERDKEYEEMRLLR